MPRHSHRNSYGGMPSGHHLGGGSFRPSLGGGAPFPGAPFGAPAPAASIQHARFDPRFGAAAPAAPAANIQHARFDPSALLLAQDTADFPAHETSTTHFSYDVAVSLEGADPSDVTVVFNDVERCLTVRGKSRHGREWQKRFDIGEEVNGAGIDLDVANDTLSVIIPRK